MTRLRPHTAAAIAAWPERPVVYRRPVLRLLASLILVSFVVWDVSMVWFPPPDDPLLASDWWLGPVLFLMLGGVYLFASARLVITRTHVALLNPLRQVQIPLEHIRAVETGSNLKVKTTYGQFHSWAVEAAKAQLYTGRDGTQADLQALIECAAEQAPRSGLPARYRWHRPDALFLVSAAVVIIDSAVLVATGPPA